MSKLFIKIISLMLIIGLNWTGLLAIGQTLASFSDTENSVENVLAVGTLNFSLSTTTDDFVNLTPEEENYLAKREVKIVQNGSLSFWYRVKALPIPQPTSQNCDKFTLTLFLEDNSIITQNLSSFETGPIQFSDLTDDLVFKIGLAEKISGTKKCKFNLEFEAWQDSSMASGFFDKEAISNYVETKKEPSSQSQDDIVINEFLPNSIGDECSLTGLDGEWVEIYNKGKNPVDLNGWYIKDEAGNTITISSSNTHTGSTIIGAQGSGAEWLVVFMNDCIFNNTGGDTVFLYDDKNPQPIDSYSYTGETVENKSYARYPDGSENWYDPIPTPGAPNVLEFEQEEITEPSISQVEDLTEESILDQENSSPQIEIEMEEATGEGNTTGNENEGLEEQDVFDEEMEESFEEKEEIKTDDGKDIEQLQETTEEGIEEVIEENFEISQEDEELDDGGEMDINEEDINEEDSISDGNVFEEEDTAGDSEEIEENAKDENIVDEIVEEETEGIDAEIDSASGQEEIEKASESDTEEDLTDGGKSEVVTEEDGGETEEGFISDQSVNDISLDKNLTEGSGEVADEDSSSNSSDIQEIEEQTGSLPNNAFISGASDESDGGDSSDSDNSDSGGIDEGNEL